MHSSLLHTLILDSLDKERRERGRERGGGSEGEKGDSRERERMQGLQAFFFAYTVATLLRCYNIGDSIDAHAG